MRTQSVRLMLRLSAAAGLLTLSLITVATGPALAQASFEGLGDLDGGSFLSLPFGTSVDGSVVVGTGTSASGQEAFRWTKADGMVGLGDLPDGRFSSSGKISITP